MSWRRPWSRWNPPTSRATVFDDKDIGVGLFGSPAHRREEFRRDSQGVVFEHAPRVSAVAELAYVSGQLAQKRLLHEPPVRWSTHRGKNDTSSPDELSICARAAHSPSESRAAPQRRCHRSRPGRGVLTPLMTSPPYRFLTCRGLAGRMPAAGEGHERDQRAGRMADSTLNPAGSGPQRSVREVLHDNRDGGPGMDA